MLQLKRFDFRYGQILGLVTSGYILGGFFMIFPHHLLAVDCTLIYAFCLISSVSSELSLRRERRSSDVKRNGNLPKPKPMTLGHFFSPSVEPGDIA